MALVTDSVMKLLRKNEEKGGPNAEQGSKIKSKAGLVINIFAALLAFNMWFQGSLNSKVMNNTIQANDLWNFYQAKSIKQTEYELASQTTTNPVLAKKFADKAASYEEGAEGKRELFAQAKKLEAERDLAKRKSPWIGYASTAYQLAIVLLSASILAVRMELFWASFLVAGAGLALMFQGLFLLF